MTSDQAGIVGLMVGILIIIIVLVNILIIVRKQAARVRRLEERMHLIDKAREKEEEEA